MSKSSIVLLLRQCRTLQQLNQIHAALITDREHLHDVFVANLLLQAYVHCRAPGDAALQIFLAMRERNIFSWNIALAGSSSIDGAHALFQRMPRHSPVSCSQMITILGEQCAGEAITLFAGMPYRDAVCWNAAMSSCSADFVANLFRRIPCHGIVACNAMIQAAAGIAGVMEIFSGMQERVEESWNLAITALAKCGQIDPSVSFLVKMPVWGLIACNTIIHSCVAHCHYDLALVVLEKMPTVDEISGSAAITAFAAIGQFSCSWAMFWAITQRGVMLWTALVVAIFRYGGMDLGLSVLNSMPQWTSSSWNSLLQASARVPDLAERIFKERLPAADLISWNTMLMALCDPQRIDRAWMVFERAPMRDVVTWNTMLQASGERMEAMFDSMPERDVISWTILITGAIASARSIFDKMPQRSVVSWTSMIQVLATRGDLHRAMDCFEQMPEHNIVAWNAMIHACGSAGMIEYSRLLFERMPQRNLASWTTAMVGASCSSWQEAERLFASIPGERDIVSWNTMLAVYARSVLADAARSMFAAMPRRDCISWTVAITASGDFARSRCLFHKMPCHSIAASNAMISTATGAGLLDQALDFFQEMPDRDEISWNIALAALASDQDHHRAREAVGFFCRMDLEGMAMDGWSFVAVLDACCSADHAAGRLILDEIASKGLDQEHAQVATAMLRFLASRGLIHSARDLFQRLRSTHPNPALWTAMINASPFHESIGLAMAMAMEGIASDSVVFLALLSSCAHTGLVDPGVELLRSMASDFDLAPGWNHYMAVVDLLGRSGRVEEAMALVHSMPFEPGEGEWMALLGACNSQGDVQRGASAAQLAVESGDRSGGYVLLFNTMLQSPNL